PPGLRSKARRLFSSSMKSWKSAGAAAAVRINPLETCGAEDLEGVMPAKPDLVLMSKVASPEQVVALEKATGGGVDLVPNVETAAGLVKTFQIAQASKRVVALLVASEDMVADLGTARTRSGEELA